MKPHSPNSDSVVLEAQASLFIDSFSVTKIPKTADMDNDSAALAYDNPSAS